MMENSHVACCSYFIDTNLSIFLKEGKTKVLVGKDNILLGIIIISDTIKENAKEAIQSLKSQVIEVIILTGDNERTTKAVTSKLKYWSNCWGISPSKERIISRLKTQEGKVVAMVGDCINDAPELVKANLGIAIGSGTDVAKVTGGIILIKDDLRDVVTVLDLGKRMVSKIKQNLFWAFAYYWLNTLTAGALVPILGLKVFGWLPILAVLTMAMSSVTDVTNSLLLEKYIPKYNVH